jgi:uncharacterized protein (TIGR02145 family)
MFIFFKIYNQLNVSIFNPISKLVNLLIFLTFFLFAAGNAQTQVPVTASTIAMGGNTENGIWVSVGQLFAQQTAQNGYEVAAGVSQAQVVDSTFAEEGCENQDYDGHGFHFSTPIAVGEHTADMYVVAGQQYHYDLRKHLTLNIFPTYDTSVYVTYHGVLPDGIHQGMNDLELLSVKGCDSLVHLYADLCPYTVMDIDENLYNTVVVSNFCWTQSNLMPTHYSNNSAISQALIYNNVVYPNITNNLNTYGRLYTWFSAVGTGEGSSASPVADAHGFVQGICPDGWHIPTLLERTALDAIPAEDLRATTLWTIADGNTNASGFTALPAGKFNSAANRFEGLGTETDWWTVVPCESTNTPTDALCPSSFQLVYYCDTPQFHTNNSNDGLSVRCVKNHEQQ